MRIWICATFLLITTGLAAQTVPADDEETEIQVEGLTKPQKASFAQFLEAQKTFAKYRASLAPNATLVYMLRPITVNNKVLASGKLDGIRLALVGKEDRIEIKIDADHRFTMPDLTSLRQQDYKLMANIGKKPIGVIPDIFSPGTSLTDRRLGDMRLTCRTAWALWKSEVSIFLRAGFGVVGGCSSNKIGFYNKMPGPVESVAAVDGGRSSKLALNPKLSDSYRVPLHDKSLSNETRLRATLK